MYITHLKDDGQFTYYKVGDTRYSKKQIRIPVGVLKRAGRYLAATILYYESTWEQAHAYGAAAGAHSPLLKNGKPVSKVSFVVENTKSYLMGGGVILSPLDSATGKVLFKLIETLAKVPSIPNLHTYVPCLLNWAQRKSYGTV